MSDTTNRANGAGTALEPASTPKPRRWDPFALFSDMESEMERFLGRRLPSFRPWSQLRAGSDWTPSVDVFEKNGKIVVQAELPGVKREDIDVSLDDGDLVIKGQRSSEKEVSEDAYYRMERFSGSFYRSLPLPAGVKPEDVSAEFQDGVLTVTVAKPAETVSEPMKVEIR